MATSSRRDMHMPSLSQYDLERKGLSKMEEDLKVRLITNINLEENGHLLHAQVTGRLKKSIECQVEAEKFRKKLQQFSKNWQEAWDKIGKLEQASLEKNEKSIAASAQSTPLKGNPVASSQETDATLKADELVKKKAHGSCEPEVGTSTKKKGKKSTMASPAPPLSNTTPVISDCKQGTRRTITARTARTPSSSRVMKTPYHYQDESFNEPVFYSFNDSGGTPRSSMPGGTGSPNPYVTRSGRKVKPRSRLIEEQPN